MCPDPIPLIPMDPTNTTTLTGPLSIIIRLVNRLDPLSTKRGIAILAACTLCLCALMLTGAIVFQAIFKEWVDGRLVGASLGCNGTVAALAGVAYRKKESEPNEQETSAPRTEASPTGSEKP